MAHFRATIHGQRGPASRLGSPKSGIHARINGWDLGVEIEARVVDGKDVFYVFKTSGSNAKELPLLIARIDPESVTPGGA